MCPRGRPRGQGRPRGLHLWYQRTVPVPLQKRRTVLAYRTS